MQRILSLAFVALCGFSVLIASAFGQETGLVQAAISAQPPQGAVMTIGSSGSRRVAPAVTGMPYSAEQVNETVQTLADGTHIRQKQRTVMMYRDSAGRTRTETPAFGPAMNETPRIVRIMDVVGGYEYTLDDQNKTAHRVVVQVAQPMARRAATGTMGGGTGQALGVVTSVTGTPVMPVIRSSGPAVPGGMPRPEMQAEDLGTQVIEGVTAHGRRTTQTWAVDSIGNDRPIVAVHENWVAEQLGGIMVLSKNNDPRYGETTTSLKNVNLSEPDPSLFQPPPGYQIVDENGSFQITVPRPSPAAAQKP